MSWMWQRGGSPAELEARYGLRPLTWRDGLLWETLATAALWIGIVLWLLSKLYDIGPYTVLIATWIGIWVGCLGIAADRFERDLPRWPRRTD